MMDPCKTKKKLTLVYCTVLTSLKPLVPERAIDLEGNGFLSCFGIHVSLQSLTFKQFNGITGFSDTGSHGIVISYHRLQA